MCRTKFRNLTSSWFWSTIPGPNSFRMSRCRCAALAEAIDRGRPPETVDECRVSTVRRPCAKAPTRQCAQASVSQRPRQVRAAALLGAAPARVVKPNCCWSGRHRPGPNGAGDGAQGQPCYGRPRDQPTGCRPARCWSGYTKTRAAPGRRSGRRRARADRSRTRSFGQAGQAAVQQPRRAAGGFRVGHR